MQHYPEILTYEGLGEEEVEKLKNDRSVRVKMAEMVEEMREREVRLTEKACYGDWLKIPTTCLAYKLGKFMGTLGVPKQIGVTLVYICWLVIIFALAGAVFYGGRMVIRRLRYKRERIIISTFGVWVLLLLLTNNLTFEDVLRFGRYDDELFLILVVLPPSFILAAYLLYVWVSRGRTGKSDV